MKMPRAHSISAGVERPDRRAGTDNEDMPEACVRLTVNRMLPSGKLDFYWMDAAQARHLAMLLLQAAEYSER